VGATAATSFVHDGDAMAGRELFAELNRAGPTAPYVIVGAVAGAALGTIWFERTTAHCNDWCLPGLVVVAAGAGAGIGALVGWSVHEAINRQ
jgi:hypothetical protein